MTFKLGKNIQIGHKIKTTDGWKKVTNKNDAGVVLTGGKEIKFGERVFGWKSK